VRQALLGNIGRVLGGLQVPVSRGQTGFLIFLGIVVAACAVIGYVLGPNVLRFAFHSERRSAPVVMVELLEFADAAAQESYVQEFRAPVGALIEALGGRRLWSVRAEDVVAGRPLDGWSQLELTQYPSRMAVVDLVTSSDYRTLGSRREAALARFAVLAATPAMPFPDPDLGAYAVRFVALARDTTMAAYDTQWSAEEAALLAQHGGRLVWRASLNPLIAEPSQRFDAMLIYGFDAASGAGDWADDPARATLETMQRRLFDRDVVLLTRSGAAPTGPLDIQN
jgi:uncharacterized protein (DUF1330 family)